MGCMALAACMRTLSGLLRRGFPPDSSRLSAYAHFIREDGGIRIFPSLGVRIYRVRFCHVVQRNRGSVAFRGFEPLHLYGDRTKGDI